MSQYHLPRAKPPKAISPISTMISPSMRLQKIATTIFDPARVNDLATFEQPNRYATGIEYVIVNGTVVIDRGEHTHARPGQILRGLGATAN